MMNSWADGGGINLRKYIPLAGWDGALQTIF